MLPCGDVVPRLQKSLKQVDFEDFGGKNMNEYDYTGDKTKNHFTAYLQKCIRWRRLIYQHVFEEKSFEEMSFLNEIAKEKLKSIYYYAIQKIRKQMRGDK